PDAPALPVRDPWPGDPAHGARLLRGELEVSGGIRPLRPRVWDDATGSALLGAAAHSFTWLRDLRALGTDAARLRARALVAEWIAAPAGGALAHSPGRLRARPRRGRRWRIAPTSSARASPPGSGTTISSPRPPTMHSARSSWGASSPARA